MAPTELFRRHPEILDRIFVNLIGTGYKGVRNVNSGPLGASKIYLSSLPENNRNDVLSFGQVDKIFHNVYRTYFPRSSLLSELPDEVMSLILDHLSPKSRRLIPPEDRASLSVESFASIPTILPQDSDQIRLFRCVSRNFARLGLSRLFIRITTRFSMEGFARLEEISRSPHIAPLVLKFSYMIPHFYPQDGNRLEQLFTEANAKVEDIERKLRQRPQISFSRQVDRQEPTDQELRARLWRSITDRDRIRATLDKARSQRRIIEERIDVKGLVKALGRLKHLQQMRLMKVVDLIDHDWAKYLGSHADVAAEFRPLQWVDACEHATKTLFFAIQESGSTTVRRFSSRFMDPPTPLPITRSFQSTVSSVASQLTCLELQIIDDRIDLNDKALQLSELFHTVFDYAVNLESLHIGFARRVSIPVQVIFHDVSLPKLKHIGLHLWHLDAQELINLLEKYQNGLVSLRLRHVSLKTNPENECSWREVLQFIRLRIRRMKWVSLRGIGYMNSAALGGMHYVVSDSESDSEDESNPGRWSDSNDENAAHNEDEDNSDMDSNHSGTASLDEQHEDGGLGSEDDGNDGDDDEDDDAEEDLDDSFSEMGRDLHESPTVEGPIPDNCTCGDGYAWNDLDDNGIVVEKSQWKKWEVWVIQHCSSCEPKFPVES